MSALAKLMLLWGHEVSGSDAVYSHEAYELVEWGAYVYAGSNEQKVCEADIVVYTAAIREDDPELNIAKKLSKKIISRDYFLKEVSAEFSRVVAVGGTHGKTTASAMIAEILFEADESFTAHIGGYTSRGNLIYRGKDIFVTEACEYNRSFLSLSPDLSLILNAEADHPDTYKNLNEVYAAFTSFASNVKRGGTVIVNRDSEFYSIIKSTYKNMLTYGIENTSDFTATNIINYGNGCYGFRIRRKGRPDTDIKLSVPGYHNIYNALGAFSVSSLLGVDGRTASRALERFNGVKGRFELIGEKHGVLFYRDYAHHPTEIRASVLTALKLKPRGRLVILFQPHTLSRTEALFEDFGEAFCDADKIFFLREYSARKEEGGKTAYDLYEKLKYRGEVYYYKNRLELCSGVLQSVRDGDIVLILGAGDISEIGAILLS